MASIDIITAAGQAYKKTWDERGYLLPMMAVPFLIKYICFSASDFFVTDQNLIRLSIIMIPAYFAEGWLLSHWARTIMLNHRWPFRPSGDEKKDVQKLMERGRGVLSGTVAFLLINLLMGGYFAFFLNFIPMNIDPQQADPKVAAVGAVMMISTLLLFRYIWFYIPLAVNIAPRYFITKVKRIGITFQMIGVWMVCFVPTIMVLQLLGGMITGAIEHYGEGTFLNPLLNLVQIALDMIKNLFCTAGMTYAFMMLFKGAKK